ncbi:MAG: hypothetical protein IT329_24365 [Caldilineaceae bacterium]|nr:hypothetical protein [Caldilineaceae bacterium]
MPYLDVLVLAFTSQFSGDTAIIVILTVVGVLVLAWVLVSAMNHWIDDYDRTEQRVEEIQAIGKEARREMQRLYDDYVQQLVQLNRR